MKDDVVVTGIGLVTPLESFLKPDIFWDALCSGKDTIRKKPLPILDFDRKWPMAEIDASDGNIFPSENLNNKFEFIAEKAFEMAVEDACLAEGSNIGLIVGTITGNILKKENRLLNNKRHQLKNENINNESLSYISSYLSAKYNLKGECFTISTACSSGTDAIGVAARKIKAKKADIIIAGGVDILSDFVILGFNSLQVLTDEKVRPFDKNRRGLVLGEGAAFVVLESREYAERRGAKIYGTIMGYSSRCDANHLTGPHREGRGLAESIEQAISQAGIKPGDIDYINAHGTGTIYNDLMETKAIKRIFSKKSYDIPISSTKSMIGHTLGAAGAIEVICCLLSIKTKIVHPTINFEQKDPECDLDYVPNVLRNCNVNMALSVSSGFGGQNSAVIVGG